MRSDDLDRVIAIEQVSFPEPWPRRFFEQEIADTAAHATATVALSEAAIVGYMVHWNMAGEIHLGNVAVDPANRRQGFGQALVDELVRRAKAVEAGCISLEVRASNRAAIALYARNLFRPAGVRRGYYRGREDAIVMVREFEGR